MSAYKDLNVTFSGCGFLGIYHLGVVSCLKDNAPAFLDRVKCFGGTSAGAFAATALLMDLNITESAEFVLRLAKRANSLTLGPLHPHFRIVETVKKSFQKILPENAHEIASRRLHISLTRVSDFKNIIVSEYTSKEDLIEALLATSHVPFYSSVLPAKFRGVYYVDGGITDNLPQHFEGETITVSPFSGESDICPQDGSPNLAYFDLRNTSIQFTLQNLYRCSRTFFPPEVEALCEMCKQGYRDTMRFLQIHYPETLSKESLRKKPSSVFRPFAPGTTKQSDSILTNQLLGRHRTRTSSTSSMSAYSTCSNSETEVFITTQDDQEGQDEQDELDGQDVVDELDDGAETDGESRLTILLDRTQQSITENELWSCYFIRKAMWVFKMAAKPCVLSVRQITNLAHGILEYLPVIEKTGIEFMDHLLAMVYVMIHTYKNKHKVHLRHDVVATRQYPRPWTKTQAAIQEASIELVQKWRLVTSHHHHHLPPSTPSPQDSSSDAEMIVSDGIEVIQDDSYSRDASAGFDMCLSGEYNMQCPVGCNMSTVDKCNMCTARFYNSRGCMLSESYDMCSSLTLSVTSIVSEEQHDATLGLWENEGGACCPCSSLVSSLANSEDYVVLDGYETDVESMISTDNCEDRDG